MFDRAQKKQPLSRVVFCSNNGNAVDREITMAILQLE